MPLLPPGMILVSKKRSPTNLINNINSVSECVFQILNYFLDDLWEQVGTCEKQLVSTGETDCTNQLMTQLTAALAELHAILACRGSTDRKVLAALSACIGYVYSFRYVLNYVRRTCGGSNNAASTSRATSSRATSSRATTSPATTSRATTSRATTSRAASPRGKTFKGKCRRNGGAAAGGPPEGPRKKPPVRVSGAFDAALTCLPDCPQVDRLLAEEWIWQSIFADPLGGAGLEALRRLYLQTSFTASSHDGLLDSIRRVGLRSIAQGDVNFVDIRELPLQDNRIHLRGGSHYLTLNASLASELSRICLFTGELKHAQQHPPSQHPPSQVGPRAREGNGSAGELPTGSGSTGSEPTGGEPTGGDAIGGLWPLIYLWILFRQIDGVGVYDMSMESVMLFLASTIKALDEPPTPAETFRCRLRGAVPASDHKFDRRWNLVCSSAHHCPGELDTPAHCSYARSLVEFIHLVVANVDTDLVGSKINQVCANLDALCQRPLHDSDQMADSRSHSSSSEGTGLRSHGDSSPSRSKQGDTTPSSRDTSTRDDSSKDTSSKDTSSKESGKGCLGRSCLGRSGTGYADLRLTDIELADVGLADINLVDLGVEVEPVPQPIKMETTDEHDDAQHHDRVTADPMTSPADDFTVQEQSATHLNQIGYTVQNKAIQVYREEDCEKREQQRGKDEEGEQMEDEESLTVELKEDEDLLFFTILPCLLCACMSSAVTSEKNDSKKQKRLALGVCLRRLLRTMAQHGAESPSLLYCSLNGIYYLIQNDYLLEDLVVDRPNHLSRDLVCSCYVDLTEGALSRGSLSTRTSTSRGLSSRVNKRKRVRHEEILSRDSGVGMTPVVDGVKHKGMTNRNTRGVGHKEASHKEVSYKEVSYKEVSLKEVSHKEVSYKEVSHKEVRMNHHEGVNPVGVNHGVDCPFLSLDAITEQHRRFESIRLVQEIHRTCAFLGLDSTLEAPYMDVALPEDRWYFTHTSEDLNESPTCRGLLQIDWGLQLRNAEQQPSGLCARHPWRFNNQREQPEGGQQLEMDLCDQELPDREGEGPEREPRERQRAEQHGEGSIPVALEGVQAEGMEFLMSIIPECLSLSRLRLHNQTGEADERNFERERRGGLLHELLRLYETRDGSRESSRNLEQNPSREGVEQSHRTGTEKLYRETPYPLLPPRRTRSLSLQQKRSPSTVIIDVANVGIGYGKQKYRTKVFDVQGVLKAAKECTRLGLVPVCVVPEYYLSPQIHATKNSDLQLQLLRAQGMLEVTPNGDYDDSYMLYYAMRRSRTCILSNDKFRDQVLPVAEKMFEAISVNHHACHTLRKCNKCYDLFKKKVDFCRKWLNQHLITYCFIGDEFIINPDFKFPEG
ncbi:Zc3h12a-like ribonuclease NYN domain protein [Gregarina niphandrodes]|uniref:Zc3h12a-like ribonuclease NYN domain protein n=1 Tax=Gregarina niphandrodes TaxID=110365 RepID=A0A023B1U8_GRENI|nr:Zc3h12a-like ribonuclease NYN domain protein [Gregarina niphandrodes]EZG48327.1 Zc3h12a-like ribonuclease NYN domain protein [Gregarina niphandrodes]|eukprot:XP_011132108.1 Zc3h12a-like ribonuclease NYN domain protein [Gregarina niphandrodes]